MSRRGHGEGTVFLRQDQRWSGAITVDGHSRKYVYGKTRREVLEKMRAARHDLDSGLLRSGRDQPVSQFLARWLNDAANSVRVKTHEAYALNVRRLTPYIGHVKLSKLTADLVQSTYNQLLAGGLSRRSVEQCHAVLHTALRKGVRWRLLSNNPADAVDVPRSDRTEMHVLDDDQLRLLLDSSKTAGDRFYPLGALLSTSGLRLGEALGLTYPNLDLDAGKITVQRALQRQRQKGLVLVEPKTRASRRTVHLSGLVVQVLRAHRTRQAEQRLLLGPEWQGSSLVFTNAFGGPLDPPKVDKALHKALDRAELPRIRVHDLRHTCATILLKRGVHPKIVQELLGHTTITITLQTYSHVLPPMHQEVASQMDAVLGMKLAVS